MRDPWGVKCRNEIGVDILVWGSDFAHATGDWPNSQEIIESTFEGVGKDDRRKMLAENAIKFFQLEGTVDLEKFGQAMKSEQAPNFEARIVG